MANTMDSDESHNSYKKYKLENRTNMDPWIYQISELMPKV
jgi:hypothetical protein